MVLLEALSHTSKEGDTFFKLLYIVIYLLATCWLILIHIIKPISGYVYFKQADQIISCNTINYPHYCDYILLKRPSSNNNFIIERKSLILQNQIRKV